MIAERLGDTPIFPVLSSSPSTHTTFMPIGKVAYLPSKYDSDKCLGKQHLLKLVGLHVLDPSLLSPSAIQFFIDLGLLQVIDIDHLIAKFLTEEGVEAWYQTVEPTDALRREALIELWAF